MKVEVEDLSKFYGEYCAVNHVSFSFNSGEVFSIIGRNGAGKTSIIRMMLGILARDSGRITIDGMAFDKCLNRVGYLAEERGLYTKDSIQDQVTYFSRLKGMSKQESNKSLNYWLDRMDLLKYKKEKLEVLSKGNQQKIQIITALIHNPDVVILDEPFSGLDPINAQLLIDIIKDLRKQNKCIMISSHQLDFIDDICDDLLIISDGSLLYHGTVEQIKKSYPIGEVYIQSKIDLIHLKDFNVRQISSEEYCVEIQGENEILLLMEKIVSEKLIVSKFEVKKKKLHDIFIKMVGDK